MTSLHRRLPLDFKRRVAFVTPSGRTLRGVLVEVMAEPRREWVVWDWQIPSVLDQRELAEAEKEATK